MVKWKDRLRHGTKVKFKFPTEGLIVNSCLENHTHQPNDNNKVESYRISVQTEGGPIWIVLPTGMVEEV